MDSSKLVFVYAGDSGSINTLIHVAHKIISPETYPCNLCGLIYNIVSEKKEWTQFMKEIRQPTEVLHRDEFKANIFKQTLISRESAKMVPEKESI